MFTQPFVQSVRIVGLEYDGVVPGDPLRLQHGDAAGGGIDRRADVAERGRTDSIQPEERAFLDDLGHQQPCQRLEDGVLDLGQLRLRRARDDETEVVAVGAENGPADEVLGLRPGVPDDDGVLLADGDTGPVAHHDGAGPQVERRDQGHGDRHKAEAKHGEVLECNQGPTPPPHQG